MICLNHQGRIFVFWIILLFSNLPPVRQRSQSNIYPPLDAENPELSHGAATPLCHLLKSRLNSFGRRCCLCVRRLCRGLLFGLFLFHLFSTQLTLRDNKSKCRHAGVGWAIKQESLLNPTLPLTSSSQTHTLDSSLVVASSVLPVRPWNSHFLYRIQL